MSKDESCGEKMKHGELGFRKPSRIENGDKLLSPSEISELAVQYMSRQIPDYAGEMKLSEEIPLQDEARIRCVFVRHIDGIPVRGQTVVTEVNPATGETVGFASHVSPVNPVSCKWLLTKDRISEIAMEKLPAILAERQSVAGVENCTILGLRQEILPIGSSSAAYPSGPVPAWYPENYRAAWVVTVRMVFPTKEGRKLESAFEVWLDPDSGDIIGGMPPLPARLVGKREFP